MGILFIIALVVIFIYWILPSSDSEQEKIEKPELSNRVRESENTYKAETTVKTSNVRNTKESREGHRLYSNLIKRISA